MAEDNPTNQKLVLLLLEGRGHRVTMVNDGRQAVSKATERVYDLILMDVQMPEMGGFEATAAIRRHERDGRRAHADRRDDGARDGRGSRAVPGRGHGRLRVEADQGGGAAGHDRSDRRARAPARSPDRPKRPAAPARASGTPPPRRHGGNRRRERVRAAHRPRGAARQRRRQRARCCGRSSASSWPTRRSRSRPSTPRSARVMLRRSPHQRTRSKGLRACFRKREPTTRRGRSSRRRARGISRGRGRLLKT